MASATMRTVQATAGLTMSGMEDDRVSLGPCTCPGTPHDEDEAWMNRQNAAETIVKLEPKPADATEFWLSFVEGGLVRWNRTDSAGEPMSLDSVREIDWDAGEPLLEWARECMAQEVGNIYGRIGTELYEYGRPKPPPS